MLIRDLKLVVQQFTCKKTYECVCVDTKAGLSLNLFSWTGGKNPELLP